MQYGVLDATGVLVDGEPFLPPFGVERPLIVVRREITVPVPRGVHEGIHGVRLARGRTAATGTLGVVEGRIELQWRFARGMNSDSSGRRTGRSSSRTGTM